MFNARLLEHIHPSFNLRRPYIEERLTSEVRGPPLNALHYFGRIALERNLIIWSLIVILLAAPIRVTFT